jgi:hypothetical protein
MLTRIKQDRDVDYVIVYNLSRTVTVSMMRRY